MPHRIVDFVVTNELLDSYFQLPDGAHIVGATTDNRHLGAIVFAVSAPDAPNDAVDINPVYRSVPGYRPHLVSIDWWQADGSVHRQSFEPEEDAS